MTELLNEFGLAETLTYLGSTTVTDLGPTEALTDLDLTAALIEMGLTDTLMHFY